MKKKFKLIIATLLFALIATSVSPVGIGTAEAAAKKPGKVKSISVYSSGTNGILVSWKKVKDAKKYQIAVSEKKNFSSKKIYKAKASASDKLIKNQKSVTKYYIKVRAVGKKNKYGPWSKVKNVTTKGKKANAETPDTGKDANTDASGHKHNWVAQTEKQMVKVYKMPSLEAKFPEGTVKDYGYYCMCDECMAVGQNWTDTGIVEHMQEVESPGWYEEYEVWHWYCAECRLILDDMTESEITRHITGPCHSNYIWGPYETLHEEHLATYEEEEQDVITGYVCSECGATKAAK